MTDPIYTKPVILAVTRAFPNLCASGFIDTPHTGHATLTDERIHFQVNACADFITDWCIPVKTFQRSISSYGWKHAAESALGLYICNGAFIAAAILGGYKIEKVEPRNPNAVFNMREPSAALLEYLDDRRMGRNPCAGKS